MSRVELKTRPSFGLLDIDHIDSESEPEVELDTPEESDAQKTSAPLTKSAKKRAQEKARLAARKAAKSGTRTPDITTPQTEAVPAAAATGPTSAPAPVPVSAPVQADAAPAPAPTPKPTPVVTKKEAPKAPEVTKPPPPKVPTPVVTSVRPASQPPFSPNLPADMPKPASPGLARKRKADHPGPEPFPKESKVELEVRKDDQGVHEIIPHVVQGPGNGTDHEKGKRMQSAITRTIWTLIMIGGFFGLMAMGPAYLILLVMLCQTLVYREVTALFALTGRKKLSSQNDLDDEAARDPWSKTINWYFFAVTNYFLYGESIIYYFKHVIFAEASFLPFATNHRFISFMLYTMGLVGFVGSLKREFLKQQFGLFCWVHMTLLIVVVSSHFIVNNILEGLIWFWIPASLVICNDVFAYIWGMAFGKTPLIKLSPKKTVEGFVGAFFSTLLFGYLWATIFMRYNYFICPVRDLGTSSWSDVTCKPNPVFLWKEYNVWPPLGAVFAPILGHSLRTIPYTPFQIHALVMATFASLVAPFGGFFASGFKRAFDIKDFGHSIPGHGGMTDRMDCQFLMGMFSYVYLSSVVRIHQVTVGGVLQSVVSGLSLEDQITLVRDLLHYLEGQGVAAQQIIAPPA
ncbi:phosphatidate cytidylyltransferase [Rhizoctonia solani 123E]|uniref:Phosphatidate cytidylyltransferase n=1 Tax=Rhizoctonia solani 123E TaxID=1423351 RepID=A0A074RQQ4_9AGAM|nr:phosphatidate cytidylyltransferase [Rhizoctonia solani 123E]